MLHNFLRRGIGFSFLRQGRNHRMWAFNAIRSRWWEIQRAGATQCCPAESGGVTASPLRCHTGHATEPCAVFALLTCTLTRSHATLKTSRPDRCAALAHDLLVGSPALDGYKLGAIEGEWCGDVIAEQPFLWRATPPRFPNPPAPYLLELLQARSRGGGMFVLSGMTEFSERFAA